MPEYFDISLIVKSTDSSQRLVADYLTEQFGLLEGENHVNYFDGKLIVLLFNIGNNIDFDEVVISISEQIFHRETFETELYKLTLFVNKCFENCNVIQFAFCSYEINAYILRNTKKLQQMDDTLFSKFPLVYLRKKDRTELLINLKAQDLW